MTKRYFDNCRTAEELKATYKRIAKELHPDNNPGTDTTAAFQEMQNEFTAAWERVKNIHVNAAGETYTKETDETAAEFMDIIEKLRNIPGIVVELCGSWLWVSGETYAAKDILKAAGFKWAGKKKSWYYHRDPYRKRGKRELSMDDIRNMYGSRTYGSNGSDNDTNETKQVRG